MNTHKKINIVLGAIIALLLVVGGIYANSLKYQRDLSQTALAKEKQQANFWKDETGKARAEVSTIQASKDIVAKVYEAEIDSLRKLNIGIGRNGKGLNSVTNVTTLTKDSVVLKTVYDTVVVNNQIQVSESLQYSDQWSQFKYDLTTSSLAYAFTDSISIVDYEKKQGFLKPRITSIQVISHSPHATITGLTTFQVEHKPKKVQFGLQAGYGITKNGFSPYAGVGVTFKIW